jgi:hypothetical protein
MLSLAIAWCGIESRRVPRDWLILWAAAGSAVGWLGASRRSMIALKTSPIWAALSQFGRPWPPFRYGSGMGLDDADRDECEEEGLLPKDEPPAERLQRLRDGAAEHQRNWNDSLAASVKGLDAKALEWLKSAFGDQISIEAESVRWTGGDAPAKSSPAPTAETATPPAAEIPPVSEVTKPVLPDVERVTTAVSKAPSTTAVSAWFVGAKVERRHVAAKEAMLVAQANCPADYTDQARRALGQAKYLAVLEDLSPMDLAFLEKNDIAWAKIELDRKKLAQDQRVTRRDLALDRARILLERARGGEKSEDLQQQIALALEEIHKLKHGEDA